MNNQMHPHDHIMALLAQNQLEELEKQLSKDNLGRNFLSKLFLTVCKEYQNKLDRIFQNLVKRDLDFNIQDQESKKTPLMYLIEK